MWLGSLLIFVFVTAFKHPNYWSLTDALGRISTRCGITYCYSLFGDRLVAVGACVPFKVTMNNLKTMHAPTLFLRFKIKRRRLFASKTFLSFHIVCIDAAWYRAVENDFCRRLLWPPHLRSITIYRHGTRSDCVIEQKEKRKCDACSSFNGMAPTVFISIIYPTFNQQWKSFVKSLGLYFSLQWNRPLFQLRPGESHWTEGKHKMGNLSI